MSKAELKVEAVLDISAGAYEEIKARLRGQDVFSTFEDREVIVFGPVALRRENDTDRVKVYLVYDGKIVPPEKTNAARPIVESEPGPDGDSTPPNGKYPDPAAFFPD